MRKQEREEKFKVKFQTDLVIKSQKANQIKEESKTRNKSK